MLGIDAKSARCAWSALAAPLAACGLYLMRRTVFVFVVALMMAYLLHPLVDAIDRRWSRRRRASAIAVPIVLILSLAGVLGTFLGRQVHKEAGQFLTHSRSQDFAARVRDWKPLGLPVGEQLLTNSKELIAMTPQLELGKRLLSASRGFIDVLIVPILT